MPNAIPTALQLASYAELLFWLGVAVVLLTGSWVVVDTIVGAGRRAGVELPRTDHARRQLDTVVSIPRAWTAPAAKGFARGQR